jgi:hypothetical protein
MAVGRNRPMKLFEVIQAYGPYVKGDLIQPTGMYREVLVKQGRIKEVIQDSADRFEVPEELDNRFINPRFDLKKRAGRKSK